MPTPLQKSDSIGLLLACFNVLERMVSRRLGATEPWLGLASDSNSTLQHASAPQAATVPDASKMAAQLWSEVEYTPPQPKQSSSVPSSRLGRLGRYLGLAGSLGSGALAELGRRAIGREQDAGGSLFLTEGNVARLVEALSRMRGAALKLGQMLSIQELGQSQEGSTSAIEQIFERVRNSAHTMPSSQTRSVLEREWGPGWRSRYFVSFDEEHPVAAASIGQVHSATLLGSGSKVAVKIQYPGVAQSVDSDLAYLRSLLAFSNLLPKGLYLDNTIRVAQAELAWEVDYQREARYTLLFHTLLEQHRRPKILTVDSRQIPICGFAVPRLYPELSTKHVLVTEWMPGFPIHLLAKTTEASVRDRVGTSILYLCLLELFKLGVMQTDPNWTNFLYWPESDSIALLDFGSTREFDKGFIANYQRLVLASAAHDVEACMAWSIQLGFLTGDESPNMKKAHLDALLALGQPFRKTRSAKSASGASLDLYDFAEHTHISSRVKESLPTIAEERLRPPPDDSYSLHRKLSGAYLLCAKLKAKVPCRALLESVTGAKICSQ